MADGISGRSVPLPTALAGTGLIGVLTALQARVNGQLGLRLDDGFAAAFVSFTSGLGILVVLSLALPVGRRGFRALAEGVRDRSIPWWMLLGGAAGAFTVATQGLVVGIIGVSLFTVGYVAGQTVCSLFLDRVGFGPGGAVAVTMPRVAGGALAVAAVVLTLAGGGARSAPTWMLVLPFLVGAGVAWQGATNGRLRQRVGTPLTATLVNFIGGTAILAVATGIRIAVAGVPDALPPEPWIYLGGAIGVTYILVAVVLVASTGVLLLALGTIVGQLLTSVVLDAIWPAASSPGILLEIVVVAVALSSVFVATGRWRRPRRRGR